MRHERRRSFGSQPEVCYTSHIEAKRRDQNLDKPLISPNLPEDGRVKELSWSASGAEGEVLDAAI